MAPPGIVDAPARDRALDHLAEHGVRVQPFQRRRGVDARARLQAGERVDLDEVHLPVLGHAEGDPAQVTAPQRAVGLARHVLRALQHVRGDLGGAADGHRVVVDRFQVVVVDAVPALGQLGLLDDVLDRREHARALRRRLLQERDGEVLAGDELLDQDAGGKARELLLDLVVGAR